MKKFIHYMAIGGIAVALIGLFTLDWFKVGGGVAVFVIAFLIDVIKNKSDYESSIND